MCRRRLPLGTPPSPGSPPTRAGYSSLCGPRGQAALARHGCRPVPDYPTLSQVAAGGLRPPVPALSHTQGLAPQLARAPRRASARAAAAAHVASDITGHVVAAAGTDARAVCAASNGAESRPGPPPPASGCVREAALASLREAPPRRASAPGNPPLRRQSPSEDDDAGGVGRSGRLAAGRAWAIPSSAASAAWSRGAKGAAEGAGG